MGPDKKYIINVSSVHERSKVVIVDEFIFKFWHVDISICRGHFGPHGGSLDLFVVPAVELEMIVRKDEFNEGDDVLYMGSGVEFVKKLMASG